MKRQYLRSAAAVVTAVAVSVLASAATAGPASGGQQVSGTLHAVVKGFTFPMAVASARDGSHRMFVAERAGKIWVVKHGTRSATPYLDFSSEVATPADWRDESGLFSLAFHRDFAAHPFLYVAYARASDGALQVSRFTAKSATATSIDPATEERIIDIPAGTDATHFGGQLAFDAQGLLLISTGDSGGSGDPSAVAGDLTSLKGKVLRIDVDQSCDGNAYCIPAGNPFAGSTTDRPEILHWGFRNPYRMSVDRADGSLWIGDVGQSSWEEIDHVAGSAAGRDFGWSCLEGDAVYDATRCSGRGVLTPPVATYAHRSGKCAVIGGVDYHGPLTPAADGRYVFADWCTGGLMALTARSGGYQRTSLGTAVNHPTGIGEGDDGEIYVVNRGGGLFHLVLASS